MPYDEVESDRQEAALVLFLTERFLQTLVRAIRIYGNSGDYPATIDFANWCHQVAGKEKPPAETWEEP